ncbi:hypothetical protein SUGI_0469760 [Cryptomeria japonica]|nr:hypothetical protein SUGI_0469760 [Cryptomeria japonica]
MGGIPADSTVLAVNQRLISIQEERIMTYDFPSNSWLQIADVPNFRYGSVFPASPEGYIYFAGGDFNTVRTKVFWAS